MKTAQLKKPGGSFALCGGSDDGTFVVKVHEGAVASIAKQAALSVAGVTRLSGSSFVDNLAELVGSKKIQDRAIAVRFSGSKVSLELSINILYGVRLPDTAEAVRREVAAQVSSMTGLDVCKLNVNIREMEDAPNPDSDENSEL